MTHQTIETNQPSAEDLLVRAAELQPWLREQQARAERERRLPDETVALLDSAGFYSLTVPRRYGGADLGARELYDVFRALGGGCGSTAWVVWATAGGNLWSCAFPESEIAPVYESAWQGNRTFALGGTSRRMSGTARRVAGGWMVEGSWPFATGSVHASHGYLAVFYDDTDDTKVGMVLVPKAQLRELDDWDATGLAGTGSQTVATDGELFVPDERFSTPELLAARLEELTGQGLGPRRGGIVRSLLTCTGVALGMADQAMEVFTGTVGRRSIPYSPYTSALQSPIIHHAVGRAHAQIRAAGRVAEAALAELDRFDAEGVDPGPRQAVQFHTDAAYVWDACAGAVETLFRHSGASAILKRQALQRITRNVRAGSLHGANNVDTWLENNGRDLCGAEAATLSTSVLERNASGK
jgi:3-hydroxy-9,10-secoandrosta-1,3,5(10)-triene-9,17-dione monooxygenase